MAGARPEQETSCQNWQSGSPSTAVRLLVSLPGDLSCRLASNCRGRAGPRLRQLELEEDSIHERILQPAHRPGKPHAHGKWFLMNPTISICITFAIIHFMHPGQPVSLSDSPWLRGLSSYSTAMRAAIPGRYLTLQPRTEFRCDRPHEENASAIQPSLLGGADYLGYLSWIYTEYIGVYGVRLATEYGVRSALYSVQSNYRDQCRLSVLLQHCDPILAWRELCALLPTYSRLDVSCVSVRPLIRLISDLRWRCWQPPHIYFLFSFLPSYLIVVVPWHGILDVMQPRGDGSALIGGCLVGVLQPACDDAATRWPRRLEPMRNGDSRETKKRTVKTESRQKNARQAQPPDRLPCRSPVCLRPVVLDCLSIPRG